MEKIVTVLTKNPIKIWSNKKIVVPLHPQTEKGALDEWLSQRSAKPSTAVRIRQAPQKKTAGISSLMGFHFSKRKVGRVIDRAGLEIRYTRMGIGGLNPSPSAKRKKETEETVSFYCC